MTKHIGRLISNGLKLAPDTLLSLPVAKDHGFYPSILYPYLQEKQKQQRFYGEGHNMRKGIRWIPSLPASQIVQDLPAFPDTQTVIRAADTLETAGLIVTERTGAFLPPTHRTYRKRDISTWWHVSNEHVARKVPAEYSDRRQNYIVSAIEVAAYGTAEALILAYWRRSPMSPAQWRKLSATEMAAVLPMDEKTIRRHLKAMIEREILVQHEQKPKLYAMPGELVRALPMHTMALN